MKTLVDIILVVFILLGTYAGVRKGLIKSLVSFIGLVAIVIISYTLRVHLANFLIDKLPFFNFGGILSEISSINILIYNILSFFVIFVLLYCVLNIVLAVTGFIDTLLKFTVIWIIPSKIGGAIIGFLESWVFIYLVLFVLTQFSVTNSFIKDSTISNVVLDHTPIVGTYLGGASKAANKIYTTIEEYSKDETKTKDDLDLYILQIQIEHGIISKDKATELLQRGKIGLKNVMIAEGENQWLNI